MLFHRLILGCVDYKLQLKKLIAQELLGDMNVLQKVQVPLF